MSDNPNRPTPGVVDPGNPNRPNPGIVEPGTGRVPPSPTRVEPAPGRVPPSSTRTTPPEEKKSGFPTVLAIVGAVVLIGLLVWMFTGDDAIEQNAVDSAPAADVTVGAPDETTPADPTVDSTAPTAPVEPGTVPTAPLEDPAPDLPTPGTDPAAPLEDPAPDMPTPEGDPNAPVLDAPATGGTTVN